MWGGAAAEWFFWFCLCSGFLCSSAAWSEDLGVTSSGLIDQLKFVLGEEEMTTETGIRSLSEMLWRR